MSSLKRKILNGNSKGHATPKQNKHNDPFFRQGIRNRNNRHQYIHQSYENWLKEVGIKK